MTTTTISSETTTNVFQQEEQEQGLTTTNVTVLRGMQNCLGMLKRKEVQALIVPINPDGIIIPGSFTDQVCQAYPDFKEKYHKYVLANQIEVGKVLWYRSPQGHTLIGVVTKRRAILPIETGVVRLGLEKVRDGLEARGIQSLAITKITAHTKRNQDDPDWNEGTNQFGAMVSWALAQMECQVTQVLGEADKEYYWQNGKCFFRFKQDAPEGISEVE